MSCKIVYKGKEYTEQEFNQRAREQFQATGSEGKKASPETLKKVDEFLKRIGVDVKKVSSITNIKGDKFDATGRADILNSLIEVTNGNEDIALTEEAMHFAVEILEQKDPTLFNQLLNRIGRYKAYNDVLNSEFYKRQYGNNIRALKKEAIGKVLADFVINKNEGSTETPELLSQAEGWWGKIKEFLKSLFSKAQFNPFEVTAGKILGGEDIGTIEDINNSKQVRELSDRIYSIGKGGFFGSAIRESIDRGERMLAISSLYQQLVDPDTYQDVIVNILFGDKQLADDILDFGRPYFQQGSEKQEKMYIQILNQHQKISKIENNGESYYEVDGKRVKNRVTDIAKRFYLRTFQNKEIEKSEYEKSVDDMKRENGTRGHADIENAFHTLVDDNGFLRANPGDDIAYVSRINPGNRAMYELLKKNLSDRLKSFPEGTRFMSEVMMYDQRRDEAGTMDLVAITKDGKLSILDWKFMDLNTGKFDDVPWYKVRAWRLQIGEYKRILKDVYGVPAEDFQQTRAIPIQAVYNQGNRSKGELPQLTAIKVGEVNVKNEPNNYLLPVGLEEETTGNEVLDKLISKLNSVYDKLSEKRAQEGEKRQKAEQLNTLYSAIRKLQVRQEIKPLLNQAKILNKNIDSILDKYEKIYKDKDPETMDNKELSSFASDLMDASEIIEIYSDLDTELSHLFENEELTPEEEELQSDVSKTANAARIRARRLESVSEKFADQKIAGKLGIKDILSPERVIKGIQRIFASTSEIPLKTLQALYKLRNEARQFTDIENDEENKKLAEIKKRYDALAKSKGWNPKNYFDIITKKGENRLIDEFSHEFYTELKKKIQEKNFDWVRDNIDTQAFKDYMKQKLEEELKRIDDRNYVGTEDEIADEIKRLKNKAAKDFDTSEKDSLGWYDYRALRRFPIRSKWESKEYKELLRPENKAAFDFYNYIKSRNDYYREIGYIEAREARYFLPYIPKSFAEKLVFGGKVSLGEAFLRGISIDASTTGYGQVDPLTGEIIDTIPKYFTSKVEGDLSTDLFRNMSLYNEAAIRYKYLEEIEGQVLALSRIEKNKGSIITSLFGKAKWNRDTGQLEISKSNEQNSKLVDDTIKAIIYGQRYISSENFDQVIGKVGGWSKKINEKLGYKIFPENLEGREISLNRTIDSVNRVFQQKVFGFNILSPLSNFLGGSIQTIINSGKHFTHAQFEAAVLRLSASKFSGENGKKIMGAIDYFLPLTENSNRKYAKQLSISKLSQENIQDFLMGLMRKSDDVVQYSIFLATLDNLVVIDNQLVNAREYLRAKPEWQKRYSLPENERRALEAEFNKKVKELVEEKGVMKLAETVDDKFTIPGVDRKSEGVFNVRRVVQRLSKDALGNLTEDEVRRINLSVYGKSMMMFKNWIPRLVDVRLAQLKYNSASDVYEWGRMRTFFRVIGNDFFHAATNLSNSLKANAKGVEFLKSLYQKKSEEFYRETGKRLEMTEEEFIDLVRANLKSQMRDFIFLGSLMGMFLAAKALPPDKQEDPEIKNAYKFMLRALDKVSDEVSFFYSPLAFQQILNGSIFPSLGMVTDIARLTQHFGGYMFDLAIGDDEAIKGKHPLKYLMKTFPVANQMSGYLPIFFPDVAKDLGIQISSQSRLH